MKKSDIWKMLQLWSGFITIGATITGLLLPNISTGVIVAFGVAAIFSAFAAYSSEMRDAWAYREELDDYKAHLKELESFYDKALHRAQSFEEYARMTERKEVEDVKR